MNVANVQVITVALENEIKSKLALQKFHVIQAELGDKRPAYPYATFKILKFQFLEEYQFGITFLPVVGDNTKVTRRETQQGMAMVSLSFFSNDYDQCFNSAKAAFNFLNSSAGKSVAEADGCGLRILNPDIEDRASIKLDDYETRFGFDFRLEGLMT